MPAGRPRLLPGRQEGKLQIEYGLLTDPAGRPVAVRVFPGNTGNTGDPAAFTEIAGTCCGTSSGWPRPTC